MPRAAGTLWGLDATHRHQPQVVARRAVRLNVCPTSTDVATDVAKLIDQRVDRRHAHSSCGYRRIACAQRAFAQQIGQLDQGIAQDVDATGVPCRTESLIDPREHTAGEVAA